jgi:alanyl-tRNA synthetase
VPPSAAQVRREFIEFFCRKHGHVFVPSSPVVPLDDPTLLFTNAGMNQFKPYFLGTETPKHVRVANTQKCIRAGGKHNDLDDVGHDTYHHTFFEMLGNWSFGDYFKKDAIAWAWELLTTVWGIDATRLHATYFGGDANEKLEPDVEARDLWLKILPAERVHAGNKKDNFWEMGETGPCGPCSEIHIDLTRDKTGGALVNKGDARAIEIWNLVFIQFNRGPDGTLTPLPAKHVDTGMGFERVTAVLQGHNNNYATDVFVPIIQAIEKLSGHTYGAGDSGNVAADPRVGRKRPVGPQRPVQSPAATVGGGSESPPPSQGGVGGGSNRYAIMRPGNMQDEACRVIADHIRCLTFALTDGAVPDREGRGYVLRRILRRAVRFGWQYLDLHEPFLCRLVNTVVEAMGGAFPELWENPSYVASVLAEEEVSFGQTLDRGIALFEEAADYAAEHHHGEIRGEDAFKLHDTYGFPIDLTQIMAVEKGLKVDVREFERLMEEARDRARATAKSRQADVSPDLLVNFGPTDDSQKYSTSSLTAQVRGFVLPPRPAGVGTIYRRAGGEIARGEHAYVVLDRTCFYASAGGQVGDAGEIVADTGRFVVEDTQRVNEVVLHYGRMDHGRIDTGASVTVKVDRKRRATMKNHTATHVLNWALREVLGDHVQQKGSLVDHEKTRFDFSQPKAVAPEEIERVEQLVNEQIARALPVYIEEIPQQEALRINGLRAVFGERYPDVVRTMCIGVPIEDLRKHPDRPEWRKYSVEFCGGTHVRNTSEIEHFVLVSEEAVAKGVRRVVGLTGPTAKVAEGTGSNLVQQAEALKCGSVEQITAALAQLQGSLATGMIPIRHRIRLRTLMEELQQAVKTQQKSAVADAAHVVQEKIAALLAQAEKVGSTTVVVAEMPDLPVEALKHGVDTIKQKCGSAVVLFGVRVAPEPPSASEREAPASGQPSPGPSLEGRGGSSDGATKRRSDEGPSPDPSRKGRGVVGGKALLLVGVTDDLIKKGIKAGDLVKAIAPLIGGGGGGPPTLAQAGGKNPEQLGDALAAGRSWIAQRL